MATLSLTYDSATKILDWTISGLSANFASNNYQCAGIADAVKDGTIASPSNIHSIVYASSAEGNSVSGQCDVSSWPVGEYTLTGFAQSSSGTYYSAGTATFYLSLSSAKLTLKLGDGIAYITGAYVLDTNIRYPLSGYRIFYPDDTIITNGIICNRFWIDQVAFKNGYTFPWNATYKGSYTTGDNHPYNGYTSSVSVAIYPSGLGATFSISASPEPNTYTVTFNHLSSVDDTVLYQSTLENVEYGTTISFLKYIAPDEYITGYKYSYATTTYDTTNQITSAVIKQSCAFNLYYTPDSIKVFVSADGFNCCFSSVKASNELPSYGDSVTFTATLNDGYIFRGWYDSSGVLISTSSSYSIAVTKSVTLYARANVKWTYEKSKGSSAITAEEWNRLQTYITQRNGSAFASIAVVGQSLKATLFNAVASAINYNQTAVKGGHIYASYLNNLIAYANKL